MKNNLSYRAGWCVGLSLSLSMGAVAQRETQPTKPQPEAKAQPEAKPQLEVRTLPVTRYRVEEYDWNAKQPDTQRLVIYAYDTAKNATEIETPIFMTFDEKDREQYESSRGLPCAPPAPGPALMFWFKYVTEGRIMSNANGGKASKLPPSIAFHVNRYNGAASGTNKETKVELHFGKSKITLPAGGKYTASFVLQISPQTFRQMSQAESLSFTINDDERSFAITGDYMKPLQDLAATLPLPASKP